MNGGTLKYAIQNPCQIPMIVPHTSIAITANHAGQIDVTAGQDTQQHTGCQHEHICILRYQVVDVLCKKYLAPCSYIKENEHKYEGDNHSIFLEYICKFYTFHVTRPFLTV